MTVQITGVDNLVSKLRILGKLQVVRAYMQAGAEYIKGKLAVFPAQRRLTRTEVYGQPFQSEKQKRFFFAALADGRIEVPYHRDESEASYRFGDRWNIAESDKGLTQTIDNDTPYGHWVMGDDQSLFMQAMGWHKVSDIAEEVTDHVIEMIRTGIEAEIAAQEE